MAGFIVWTVPRLGYWHTGYVCYNVGGSLMLFKARYSRFIYSDIVIIIMIG
jgi:hypothetical protein